ncbi:unnamed protein product [Blepharisma stoltei]|uniref:CS domain-containing protein n=1 Tax=Blepharisma stoltei TaxID=1481888 RepID=A0AAU9IAR4_9CILI|nr:unnamed protein product [Blepharisma stoltei]
MSKYTWEQEFEIIKITIPCRNPILSKKGYFDLFLSRNYVKFHLKSPKMFMEWDLAEDIDYKSPLNRAIAKETCLELILAKFIIGKSWESLICSDKDLSKQRRALSISEFEQNSKETQEALEKHKIEMDRFSVTEQMKLDDERRRVIEQKKEEEKIKAEQDIFSPSTIPSLNNEIFKERTDLPEVRGTFKQKIEFTPRKNPNVPARESNENEPPLPHNIKPLEGPVHESHPLWLKDKGNELFSKGDFESAISAYSNAIKADQNNLACLMNRAASYMKIYEFQKALDDLYKSFSLCTEDLLKGICKVRIGAILAWKGLISEAIDEYNSAKSFIPDDESIQKDIEMLEKRRESNLIKNKGDLLYKEDKIDEAKIEYTKSLEIDPENELSIANLAQIFLKKEDKNNCVEMCDKALELISHNLRLKCKVLLRKAEAIENKDESLALANQVLQIEPQNQHAKILASKYTSENNRVLYENLKQSASDAFKNGNAEEALKLYKEALGLCKKNKEEKASIYTNISACYLLLKNPQDVIITVDKAFKLEPKPSLQLRLHWRRAKAYAEMGQLYSATADLNQALKLDPDNQAIKQDLELIRKSQN